MIFIDNKYTKWYFSIIRNSKFRRLTGYTEKHHIIPKSLGGLNVKDNIAVLTAREHYICHLLLTKMTSGVDKHKMIHAAVAFVNWASSKHERNMKINSRIYLKLKQSRSETIKHRYQTDSEYAKKSISGIVNLWKNPSHMERMSELRKDLWKDDLYRAKMMNRPPTNVKQLSINGILFNSCKDAANHYGLTANCVAKRCLSKSKTFINWFYI